MASGVIKGKPSKGRRISPLNTRFSSLLTRLISSMSKEDIAIETPRGVDTKPSSEGSQRGFQLISKGSSPRAQESRG